MCSNLAAVLSGARKLMMHPVGIIRRKGNDRESRDPWVIKLLHFRGYRGPWWKRDEPRYPALISRSRIALLCLASSYIVFRTDFRPGFCCCEQCCMLRTYARTTDVQSAWRERHSFVHRTLKWTSASSLCCTWRTAWNNSYYRITKWMTYYRVILSMQQLFPSLKLTNII